MNRFRLALAGLAVACAGSEAQAPVFVPSGQYQLGSDAKEREWGYQNAPPVVREQQWYDAWERPPEAIAISGFEIDRSPVTQERYGVFVRATGRNPGPRGERLRVDRHAVRPGAHHAEGMLLGRRPGDLSLCVPTRPTARFAPRVDRLSLCE